MPEALQDKPKAFLLINKIFYVFYSKYLNRCPSGNWIKK